MKNQAYVTMAIMPENNLSFIEDYCNFITQLKSKTSYDIWVITDEKTVNKLPKDIHPWVLKNVNVNNNVPSRWKFNLNKLNIFDLYNITNYNKMIFLDCDLILKDSPDDLFNELKPNVYNVCKQEFFDKNSNMTNNGVFGLYYIDKSLILNDKLNILNSVDKIRDFEQGALHYWFSSQNRINYLNNIWNTSDLDLMYLIYNNIDYQDIKIIHLWFKKSMNIADYQCFGKFDFVNVSTLRKLFKFINCEYKTKIYLNKEN